MISKERKIVYNTAKIVRLSLEGWDPHCGRKQNVHKIGQLNSAEKFLKDGIK